MKEKFNEQSCQVTDSFLHMNEFETRDSDLWPSEASPEEKAELQEKIEEVASTFNSWGKDWFAVGGLSMELAIGEPHRFHEDIDIAIYEDDKKSLNAFMQTRGYAIEERGHVVHYFMENHPNDYIEVLVLYRDAVGKTVTLDPNDSAHFSIPQDAMCQSSYKTSQGPIPLMPLDGNIFMKLLGGRQKDLFDIMRAKEHMTEIEKQRLTENLRNTGNDRFGLDGAVISNLDDLITRAYEKTGEDYAKFRDEHEAKLTEQAMELFLTLMRRIKLGESDDDIIEPYADKGNNIDEFVRRMLGVIRQRVMEGGRNEYIAISLMNDETVRHFINQELKRQWMYAQRWTVAK